MADGSSGLCFCGGTMCPFLLRGVAGKKDPFPAQGHLSVGRLSSNDLVDFNTVFEKTAITGQQPAPGFRFYT